MLNEAPKKQKKKKDYSNPTKWQYFWRIQGECLRRSVTPYLMYLFMSLLALACQTIDADNIIVIEIVLGILCIAGGAFFNGHLLYHTGKIHYGSYIAGQIHRKNIAFGIASGSGHRPEREYRIWKGFLIGFYIALPAIILGIIAGSIDMSQVWGYVQYAFIMFAGWAILPITFFGTAGTAAGTGGLSVSMYWSLLMALLPILVSGIFYIVGAYSEARSRARAAEHDQEVQEAGKNARKKVGR